MTTARIVLLGLLTVASAQGILGVAAATAASNPADASSTATNSEPQRYIVLLADRPAATYEGGVPDLAATSPRVTGERHLAPDGEATVAYRSYLEAAQDQALDAIGRRIGRTPAPSFRYSVASNGFAIDLTAEEARAVATVPGVVTVELERMLQLQTDFGPGWIQADALWNNPDPSVQTEGEGVLIGILDTGLNLDHPSFAAVGSDGYPHTNPFGSGVYRGLCASDPVSWTCNDKLVGYWIFTGETSEDTDGHGSRVASIAAGNVLGAGLVDLTPWAGYSPAASGVARHANLIGYDVCLDGSGCPTSATLAGIDQAVLDGVDVFNYSLGGAEISPWTNSNAQAMLAADAAGVVVVTAAGNTGPGVSTISSPANAPWVLATASATHLRTATNTLLPLAGGSTSPPPAIAGAGLSDGTPPSPIVYAGDYGDALCLNPFPPGTWSGEIVVCDRGAIARVAKGWNVLQGGAGGLVLVNAAPTDSLDNDIHHLPAVHVDSGSGAALKAWLASGSGHSAQILGATIDVNPSNADILAVSSARGPSLQADVLKPDLTAPGVEILGALSSSPPSPSVASTEYGISGSTSFASPHVAGAAALVRALHPSWTPAQIRSALASTADPTIVVGDGVQTPANPFEGGAGRVLVPAAADVGLVMDESAADFTAAEPAAGGDPTTLNLPSLVAGACCGCSWTRTFEAVANGNYEIVSSGVPVTATPGSFSVTTGGTQQVVFTPSGSLTPGVWSFGEVTLNETSNQSPPLRLPVAVKPGSAAPPPETVGIATSEPTGTELVPGVESAREITDLTSTSSGLTRGTMVDESLSQDPTNSNPYDNLNDGTTFYVTAAVSAGAEYLVAEILESEASDMDLYVGTGSLPSAATMLCASTTTGSLESCRLDAPPAGDYWILVQNWTASGSPPDDVRLSYAVVGTGARGTLTGTGPATAPACTPFDLGIAWYVPTPRDGERYYGSVRVGSSAANPDDIGTIDVTVDFAGVTHWSLCSTPDVAIPDLGSITDTATMAETLILDDVDVRIVADHTWVGDLIFSLEHVGGTTVTLIDRPGVPLLSPVGCGEDDVDVVVDDQGTGDIESQCDIGPAISGRRVGGDPPAAVLAAYRGESFSGDWQLTVSDNAEQDTGALVSWCLDVSLSAIFADGFESGTTSAWSSTSP